MEQQFKGLSFTFRKDKFLSGRHHGQSGGLGTYSLSDNKLFLDDELFCYYRISDNKLDLIYTRAEIKIWDGMPKEFEQFAEIEAVWSFNKINK